MSNILEKICEDKKIEIESIKRKCSLHTLKKLISDKITKRSFKEVLIQSSLNKDNFIIGSQQRSEIFKRHHIRKEKIYNSVLEIEERISINGKILTHLNKSKIYKKLEFFYKNGINSISIVLLNR